MSGGGDTPSQTLFKYHALENNIWFFGEFVPVENFLNAKIYGENENNYYILNESGQIIAKNSINITQLEQEIGEAIENTYHQQVNPIVVVATEYQIGNQVENWADFNIVAR